MRLTKEELFESGLKHCRDILIGGSQLIWTVYCISADDKNYIITSTFKDNAEKQKTFNFVRLFTVANAIDEYFFVNECWMAHEDPKKMSGLMPAEREDKIEVIVMGHVKLISGELKMDSKIYQIIRENNSDIELKEISGQYKVTGGDLFTLMSTKTADSMERQIIKELINAGIENKFFQFVSVSELVK